MLECKKCSCCRCTLKHLACLEGWRQSLQKWIECFAAACRDMLTGYGGGTQTGMYNAPCCSANTPLLSATSTGNLEVFSDLMLTAALRWAAIAWSLGTQLAANPKHDSAWGLLPKQRVMQILPCLWVIRIVSAACCRWHVIQCEGGQHDPAHQWIQLPTTTVSADINYLHKRL